MFKKICCFITIFCLIIYLCKILNNLKFTIMKKIILSLVFVFTLLAPVLNAQRYSELKFTYDYHKYISQPYDKYNPSISGLCSFIIPGLGQIVCEETGRGLAFFAGSFGCYLIANSGAVAVNSGNLGGSFPMLAGLGGMLAIDIWAIVDANHVAKVKNMYFQDKRKTSKIELELAPYLEQLSINNENVIHVGMTMRLKF